MSFLKKSLDNDEPDTQELMEEQYERLFPKIGRDFVSIQDLRRVLNLIEDGLGDNFNVSEARTLALEYRGLLDSGKSGTGLYQDLIDMSED